MDELKTFAKNDEELQDLLTTVKQFSVTSGLTLASISVQKPLY